MPHEPWLVAEGLRYAFPSARGGRLPVLDDLSISVNRGELVSLVGPSGCGKSTLLNLVAGLLQPQLGHVRIGGTDTTGTTGHVAYMMQDDLLLPWRTVLENVTLGPELGKQDKRKAATEALGLMEKFGLAGFEHYYPHALSGGMRQRVALMRTVLCKREVLLLDEPFRGVDVLTKHRLHEWLLKLWAEFGLTILFITHDPEEAVFLSDRIYVLSRRPTTAKRVVTVDLPRPRRREVIGSADFARLKGETYESLWREDDEELLAESVLDGAEPVPGVARL
jgi:ABC-type nitrate/sulfonate/bicarbonate transport system ATPase subunit